MKKISGRRPHLPLWISKQMYLFSLKEGYSGDIEEEYWSIREDKGKIKSGLWLWGYTLKSVPILTKLYMIWSFAMFKNYVKIALRNLKKHKVYSTINIFGLALGIASCILIFLFVKHEWSYDKFHKNTGSLYRVYTTEAPTTRDPFSYVESPWHLAEALEQTFPEVKRAVRLDIREDIIRYQDKNFSLRYHLVDPDFLEMFTFPLLQGNTAGVLQNTNSVVLTINTAQKIFGSTDPMGKQISIKLGDEYYDFLVKGIAKNVPSNSSIKFDILIPIENVKKYVSPRSLDHWLSVFFETYVQLSQPLNSSEIKPRLKSVVNKHYNERFIELITLNLQPMNDIHLNPNMPSGFETSSNPKYSYIMIAIAILMLGVACINFMMLSVGRSATRAKEVGVRKVLGVEKHQLIKQFLGEALLMSFSALLLGFLLARIFLPTFNWITSQSLSLTFSFWTLLFLIILMFLVGMISGSYPAFYISRFQAVHAMRKKPNTAGTNTLLRSLVIGQFAFSIGLIICTLTISEQSHFLLTKDLGFKKENVAVIENHGTQDQSRMIVERYRNSLAKHPEILGISGTSTAFARDWTTIGFNSEDGTYKQFFQLTVDYEYLKVLNMELIEGRDFSREYGTDVSEAIIVNEAFMKYLNWDSIKGKRLPSTKFPPHRFIGVVKNFNFETLRKTVAPLVMVLDTTTLNQGINDHNTTYNPRLLNFINVRIESKDILSTMEILKNEWQEAAPGQPFEFTFLDQDVEQQYREIKRWGKIMSYASILTIIIACLGLFGLVTLTVTHRTKEIGIRKVLGASSFNIVFMLSNEFGKLVLLANILAWPIAFFIMKWWLQDFAYRVGLSVDKFLTSAAVTLIIALLTVSFQSVRAALSDPVDIIKYE